MRSRDLILIKEIFVIGLTAFGGPQAHIAMMQNVLVKKRAFLTDEELLETYALCQMLPGPASTQTIIAISLKQGGTLLAILALLAWMLPAVILMTLITVLFSTFERFGFSLSYFQYVQPVAIGIIGFAGFKLGDAVIKSKAGMMLMIFGLLTTILYPEPWTFPLAIAIGGAISNFFTAKKDTIIAAPQPKINWTRSWLSLTLLILIFVLAAFLGAVTNFKPFVVFENMYRFGAITFGGGNVLVPMMFEQFVKYRQYLSAQEFVSGYAINQAIPGPAFAFAAFTGGMALHSMGYHYQILGCLLSAIAIFLPGMFMIFFIFPFWQYFKKYSFIRRSLEGVNAVATGLVLGSAVVLYANLQLHWANAFIVAGTFMLLHFTKIKAPWLVLAALAIGFVIEKTSV
ncbi:MAG: chromate efflux transporter [Pseudomonadota bacterium]